MPSSLERRPFTTFVETRVRRCVEICCSSAIRRFGRLESCQKTSSLLADLGGLCSDRYTPYGKLANYSEPPPVNYQNSYQPRWDAWGRFTQPIFSHRPMQGLHGNHEVRASSRCWFCWLLWTRGFCSVSRLLKENSATFFVRMQYAEVLVFAMRLLAPFKLALAEGQRQGMGASDSRDSRSTAVQRAWKGA